MYLYRWEDGSYWQSQEPPDEVQKEAIQDGVLEVFTIIGGKFTEITAEGYVDVNTNLEQFAEDTKGEFDVQCSETDDQPPH